VLIIQTINGVWKMEIIIVGCGKVGSALATKLDREGHNITVIDTNAEKIRHITEDIDVMGIVGNGSSIDVLTEADMENADVFIAVTGSDELNLLCCMFAKKAGNCRAVARVRNPMYSHQLEFIKEQLGISTIINPELAAAREISRLLRFPAANKIDTFADGRVRLIKFELEENSPLENVMLKDISAKIKSNILICAVERGHEVIIPDGSFVFDKNDIITFAAAPESAKAFFKELNMQTRAVKNVIIIGGGTIGFYLAKELIDNNINVKIVDHNLKRCEELAEVLPDAMILHGDGSDRAFLMSEDLPSAEAVVNLTNMDEENILTALFCKKHSNAKTVTKINRLEFDDIIEGLDIGSVIYPKYITCDFILQHVRSLQNASGSNIKTLYNILDDRVEALEFTVHNSPTVTDVPLYQLKLKSNMLICCITRGKEVIIPKGNTQIHEGDSVIVITLEHGLRDISDIIVH